MTTPKDFHDVTTPTENLDQKELKTPTDDMK